MAKIVDLVVIVLLSLSLCCLSGCETKTTPRTGTLNVSSSPRGAEVYLDYRYRGTTPVTIMGVSVGTHTIELRQSGYETWTASGTMDEGGSAVVQAILVPIPATLPVSTYPPTQGAVSTYPPTPEAVPPQQSTPSPHFADVGGLSYTNISPESEIRVYFNSAGNFYFASTRDLETGKYLYKYGEWNQAGEIISVKYAVTSSLAETTHATKFTVFPNTASYSCLNSICLEMSEASDPEIIYRRDCRPVP
jgi:hypothetical protein